MPMLFPLLIISLAGLVSSACRHYMSRHLLYARIVPPGSFFVTSAWLKHLQLLWKSSQALIARMWLAFSHCLSWTPGCTNPLHLCATGTVALQPKLALAAKPQVHTIFCENSKSWWDLGCICSCSCSVQHPCLSYLQSRGGLWYLCQPQCAVSGAMSRCCGTLPTSSSHGSSSDLAAGYISLSLFAGSVPPSCPICLVEGLWHCQSSPSAHRASSEQDSPCSVFDPQCWLFADVFKVFLCVNCRYI